MSRVYRLGAALALLSGSAYAADLPERVVVPPAPVFTWGGAYIGFNIGYGGDTYRYPFAISGVGTTISTKNSALTSNGPLGGGQVGYNFALPNIGLPYDGGVVGGVEVDYDLARIGGNAILSGVSPLGAAGIGTGAAGTTTSSFGTVRGRLGLSFGRLLLFGTGGFAFAEARTTTNVTVGGIGTFNLSSQTTHKGVVFGGGAEYLVTENITAKIEYLRTNLDLRTVASGASGTRSFAIGEQPSDNIIRIGLNYKIDPLGAQPIPFLPLY